MADSDDSDYDDSVVIEEDVETDAEIMPTDESEQIDPSEPDSDKPDAISGERAADLINDAGDFKDHVLDESEQIESYEVNEFSTVELLYYPRLSEHLYRVIEPELTKLESTVRARITRDIEELLENEPVEEYDREELREQVRNLARQQINYQQSFISRYGNSLIKRLNNGSTNLADRIDNEQFADFFEQIHFDEFEDLSEESINRILYFIERDFVDYEKLTPIMDDISIEDVSCNAPGIPLFVYHGDYQDMVTNVTYQPQELNAFVSSLAQEAGKHISIADPNMQGRLPDGSRVQLTFMEEISPAGSNFTIRKFQEEPFTPVELIEYDTFSLAQIAYLWLAIENDKSLIFAGDTASGKTTSMNAMSLFIPPRSKVVSIEDTRELVLRHSNWIKSVTRESFGSDGSGGVDMYELLRNALRQRPEYIVVGEIRGSEAQTLFQAMNTGHTTYSTMHAEDVPAAIHRLENDPINLPRQMLEALDIMSIQMRTTVDGKIVRRCKEMVEIVGVKSESQQVTTRTVFEYNPKTDKIDYKGTSKVLEDIRTTLNLTEEEIQKELENRKIVLEYLRKECDEYDYRQITDILRTYMQDKEKILNKIEDGTLETP